MINKSYIRLNEKFPLYDPKIININENNFINIQLFEKRGKKFFEVIFNNNGKEFFIGTFHTDMLIADLQASYKDGKILVFEENFIEEIRKVEIVKVDVLYSIIDDCIYSCTEEEALKIFDETLNTSYLKNKQNYLNKKDFERIKKRNI